MRQQFVDRYDLLIRDLSPSQYKAFSEATHTCAFVHSADEFKIWWTDYFQRLIPHTGLLCYRAQHDESGTLVTSPLAIGDYPAQYIDAIRNENGLVCSPILQNWWRSRRPVLFDPQHDIPCSDEWYAAFKAYDLQKAAVHGIIGPDFQTCSCFSLVRIDCEWSSGLGSFLEVLAPLLHQCFMRALPMHDPCKSPDNPAANILTKRELQIVTYMASGLTMAEIAEKVHRSIHTVKNHARSIFIKLECSNRAAVINKAFKLNLLR